MQRFFSTNINGDVILLSEEEAWHCTKVMRMMPGDLLSITDGKGNLYECELLDNHPKKCIAKILTKLEEKPRSWKLHIAIAPTKNNDRLEWFIEKATEIGIDIITPLYTAHSERTRIKPERIQKILISAMKQSLKCTVPILETAVTFGEIIRKPFNGQKFIAYCETGSEESLITQYKKNSDVLILVGPEGDFSPQEVALSREELFIPVNLGEARLRTETAGVVACHTIHLLNHIGR